MPVGVETIEIVELNNDQRREFVNTRQRFAAWQSAREKAAGYRGSLVWHEVGGRQYLIRAYYDRAGLRRQKTEGLRGGETEALKHAWDKARAAAEEQRKSLEEVVRRQAAINRALGLGRVPLTAAKILRQLDNTGLLGKGIRVVGTNAIYAYEAAAGILVDAAITATVDIDLLWDDRRRLRFLLDPDVDDAGMMGLLRRADASFVQDRRSFSAKNREGYSVDFIRVESRPPWRAPSGRLSQADNDIEAVAIEGLQWLQNSPPFDVVAIDEKGGPVRIVASDPRVFAIHKLWLASRPDREPVKRQRDAAQARAVAGIVRRFLPHLPYEASDLRMLPRALFDAAAPLFAEPG